MPEVLYRPLAAFEAKYAKSLPARNDL